MLTAHLIDEKVLDLTVDSVMIFEPSKGEECIRMFIRSIEKGYTLPPVDVVKLQESYYTINKHLPCGNVFQYGGHHRIYASYFGHFPLPVKVWELEEIIDVQSHIPLREAKLVDNCNCGGYSWWDKLKKQDALSMAKEIGKQFEFYQKFLDTTL